MTFSVQAQDSKTAARAGTLETPHGVLETPVFMPVGTQGTVKGVNMQSARMQGLASILLGNTYHLYLRPGLEVLSAAGGLRGFMSWPKALLTDSGGYQVFSLSSRRKIEAEGLWFRSHIDGSTHRFTPAGVVDMQRTLGADILMPLDDCAPYPCSRAYLEASCVRTRAWLRMSLQRMAETQSLYGYPQELFPIVQGGMDMALRGAMVEDVLSHAAAGYAIGGLSVGEPRALMYEMVAYTCGLLPEHVPRYLMGVGMPWDLLECIGYGVDMFDCVIPTRNARNGMLFTLEGVLNIRNARWKHAHVPLDAALPGALYKDCSRAYLRHLFMSKELLGYSLASVHNLCFYAFLLREARTHILSDDYGTWKKDTIARITRRL